MQIQVGPTLADLNQNPHAALPEPGRGVGCPVPPLAREPQAAEVRQGREDPHVPPGQLDRVSRQVQGVQACEVRDDEGDAPEGAGCETEGGQAGEGAGDGDGERPQGGHVGQLQSLQGGEGRGGERQQLVHLQ